MKTYGKNVADDNFKIRFGFQPKILKIYIAEEPAVNCRSLDFLSTRSIVHFRFSDYTNSISNHLRNNSSTNTGTVSVDLP